MSLIETMIVFLSLRLAGRGAEELGEVTGIPYTSQGISFIFPLLFFTLL
jgi:hypothetical protein